MVMGDSGPAGRGHGHPEMQPEEEGPHARMRHWAWMGSYVLYRCEAHHTLKAFSLLTGNQTYLHMPPDKEPEKLKR